MKLYELELGDVLFTINAVSKACEHVSVFLGLKDGIPYIIHASSNPYDAVMVTHLIKNDVEYYQVLRPKNKILSIEAINILLCWVEYRVPYATQEKRDKIIDATQFMQPIGIEYLSTSLSIKNKH